MNLQFIDRLYINKTNVFDWKPSIYTFMCDKYVKKNDMLRA